MLKYKQTINLVKIRQLFNMESTPLNASAQLSAVLTIYQQHQEIALVLY